MRLAAIYIPGGLLPHLFGKKHAEMTINLGGKNLYTVSGEQIITVKPNAYFLDDLFSQDISLLSAIVGSNGGGKTSLLRLLTSNYHCLYVLELEDESYKLSDSSRSFHRVYYTPYLNNFSFGAMEGNGKDLSKFSLLKSDNHGDSALLMDFLESHESENMKRWIKFNHFFRQLEFNKVILPTFSRLTMSFRHFDLTVHQPRQFHDTATQLQPVITLILRKIEEEKEQVEGAAVEGHDIHDNRINRIYFPIRFKYDLYELALAKLVSVFERRGNRYLQEGIIPDDFDEQLTNLDARNAIQWFLENGGVHAGATTYSFSRHLILLDLIDYVVSLIDVKRITTNWREIQISEAEALQIIELYDRFNESFINEWFEFDTKPMFAFRPQVTVSSGEQSYLDLFSTLYYHAGNIAAGIDIDEYNGDSLEDIEDDILLLLDEGDNAFHPQWKKEYVKYLREMLPLIFPDFKIQIILTSHDPLTLSDLPKNNVVYLEKADGVTRVSNAENKRTLGANISDLLKDSFFIQDGQIGGFIASVIDGVITDIRSRQIPAERKIAIERIIHAIDEPVLKFKMAEMLTEALGNREFELQLIDEEIRRLQQRRGAV